jgi:NRPS condensation-like uncharacterized protein
VPRSFPLTPWDGLQLLTKKFSDQQVRMVIELDGRLEESRLAEAIRAAVAAEPVLGCRVQDRFFRPRWKPLARFDPASLLRVVPSADPAADVHKLLTEDLDPWAGPVVRIGLVRAARDMVVVNLDHTAGDAASVRSLCYLLAALYGDPRKVPPAEAGAYFAKRGFGSLRPLMPSAAGRKGLLGQPPAAGSSWRFPWQDGIAEYRKRLLIRGLSPAKADAFRTFVTSRKAWPNDVFLTAYFRALGGLLGPGSGVPRITIPVDLRSYLPARERPRIANFSASFELALKDGLGGSFDETLGLIRAVTAGEKCGRPGLAQAAALSSFAGRIPFRIAQRRFTKGKIRMVMPPPWFIALGVLRPESLAFGPVPARHAYSLQSVSRAGGVFQLSASLYGASVTLAVCFAGDDANEAVVNRFLDLYEGELPAAG